MENNNFIINQAQKNLDNIRDITIGITRRLGNYSLVIEYDEHDNYAIVVDITQWGAIQTTHLTLKKTEVNMIPNGETLSQLLKKPLKFGEFINNIK